MFPVPEFIRNGWVYSWSCGCLSMLTRTQFWVRFCAPGTANRIEFSMKFYIFSWKIINFHFKIFNFHAISLILEHKTNLKTEFEWACLNNHNFTNTQPFRINSGSGNIRIVRAIDSAAEFGGGFFCLAGIFFPQMRMGLHRPSGHGSGGGGGFCLHITG